MAARALDGKIVGGATVVSPIVPNSLFTRIDAVREAIETLQPEAVVMLGEYGGRAMITVERYAHNIKHSTRYALRDNAGCLLQGVPPR